MTASTSNAPQDTTVVVLRQAQPANRRSLPSQTAIPYKECPHRTGHLRLRYSRLYVKVVHAITVISR
ncbi:hypothetical protein M8818_002715 [Zalaria obscura]|uniref:Uncharacterized protein n=1 Tax=Zalaria obscura TaxID=2024903 RepID=A0ACC3SIQ0_9PEZI